MTTKTTSKVKARKIKMTNDQTKIVIGSVALPVNTGNPDSKYVPHSEPYVDTHGHLETIAYAIENNLPVLLIGETGTGKTSAIRHLAKETNNSFRRVNLNGSTTVDELVGKILINKDGTYWTDGVLIDAMRHGHWLLLDEINAALPEVLFCLQSLLDDDRYVVLSEKSDHEVVKPHPNFRIFATCNPFEKYTGTKELNKAFLSRFPVVIDVPYPTQDQEMEILKLKTTDKISEEILSGMIKTANAVRESVAKDEMDFVFSTRDLIYWAQMYEYMQDSQKAARTTFLAKANKEDSAAISTLIATYVRNVHTTQQAIDATTIQIGQELTVLRDFKALNASKIIVAGTKINVLEVIPADVSPFSELTFRLLVATDSPIARNKNNGATPGEVVTVTSIEISGKVASIN